MKVSDQNSLLSRKDNNQVLSDTSSNDNSGKFPLKTQGEVNDQNSLLSRKDNNQVLSDASSDDFNSGKFPLETQVEVSDQNSLLSSPLEILLNLFDKEPTDIEMFAKEISKGSKELQEVLFKKQYLRYSSGLLFTFDNSDNVDVYFNYPNRQNCFELTNLSKTDFLQAIRLNYPDNLNRISDFIATFKIRLYNSLDRTFFKEILLEPTKMNFIFINMADIPGEEGDSSADNLDFTKINENFGQLTLSSTDCMVDDERIGPFNSSLTVLTYRNQTMDKMGIINLIVKEVDKEQSEIDSSYNCFKNDIFRSYRVPKLMLFDIKNNLKTCLAEEINIIDILL